MPELPEVEEVRRSLEPHLLGVVIARIEVVRKDFLTPRRAPIGDLVRQSIARTLRHGKKLFLIAGDQVDDAGEAAGQTLLIHLGMSGRVDCLPAAAPVEKHTHVIIELANGTHVRLRDPRRFGGLWYYPTLADALKKEVANLGPDALVLTPAHFAHWRTTRGRLKQRLLSQRDVAGLGNIYVDEALYLARLHPLQRVDRIKPERIQVLVQAILEVLHNSIRSGGTTLRDYRNVSNQPGDFARRLQAYGRGGEPCLRCKTPLKSTLIAGRTTVHCPNCQRRG